MSSSAIHAKPFLEISKRKPNTTARLMIEAADVLCRVRRAGPSTPRPLLRQFACSAADDVRSQSRISRAICSPRREYPDQRRRTLVCRFRDRRRAADDRCAQVILDAPEIAAFQAPERLWQSTRCRSSARCPVPCAGHPPDEVGSEHLADSIWEAGRRPGCRTCDQMAAVQGHQCLMRRNGQVVPSDFSLTAPPLLRAGQYLPIRLPIDEADRPPSEPIRCRSRLRITSTGSPSNATDWCRSATDDIGHGDVIGARAPAGEFTIDATQRAQRCCWRAASASHRCSRCRGMAIYEGLRTQKVRTDRAGSQAARF